MRPFFLFIVMLSTDRAQRSPCIDHRVQCVQCVRQAAHLVDQPACDGLITGYNRSRIRGQFCGLHHHSGEFLGGDMAVRSDKPYNPLLNLLKIGVSLGRSDDRTAHAHRMDGHSSRGRDKRAFSRDGERYTDGVTTAEDEGNSRLSHSCDEFGDGEAGFDVAADGIEQYEQAVDLVGLLNRGDLGDNVFVFGGFGLLGRFHVAFDLADDGDGVDDTAARASGDRAGLGDVIHRCGRLGFLIHSEKDLLASSGEKWDAGGAPPGII